MSSPRTRRELIRDLTLAAGLSATGGVFSSRPARASKSPNEKLNIGIIGAGGQGASDLGNVASQNIVALCDVDAVRAADAFNRYPSVPKYTDFRKLIEQKDVEAVTVSTPDHCHAAAAVMAIKMGKHVYCQKPLCRTVHEARTMTEVAAKHPKVATQMGHQNHSHESYIRTVEYIQAGAIGKVHEVHVVTDRPIWPQGMTRPSDTPAVPATLDWDRWLGPARERPFHPAYLPFVWRGWWDFGTGALGDMACHLMDPAFWALKLKFPTAISAVQEGMTADSPPKASIVTYEFPQRGELPPVKLIWYDGGKMPGSDVFEGMEPPRGFNGSVFVGDGGKLYIEHGTRPILLPDSKFGGYEGPEKTLHRPPAGHHMDWIEACKNGTQPGSNFSYSGPMTEAIALGNVAMRLGRRIEYDWKRMKVKGAPEADALIREPYRAGYRL